MVGMQTNEAQNSIESMAALKLGWDGHHTPQLPKECLEAAKALKTHLDEHYPKANYQLFPGPGGFIEFAFFRFDDYDFDLWVYGKRMSGMWCEYTVNDLNYSARSLEVLKQFLPEILKEAG